MTETTYDIQVVQLQRQPVAVVRAQVTTAQIPAFLGAAFEEVMAVLSAQALAPAGPPFARYTITGEVFDVEAGFPATGQVRATGRVLASELPAGPAAQVLHRGPYAEVASAYEAAAQWLTAHGYAPDGPSWEAYLDQPDVPEPRTLVHLPCRALPTTG